MTKILKPRFVRARNLWVVTQDKIEVYANPSYLKAQAYCRRENQKADQDDSPTSDYDRLAHAATMRDDVRFMLNNCPRSQRRIISNFEELLTLAVDVVAADDQQKAMRALEEFLV